MPELRVTRTRRSAAVVPGVAAFSLDLPQPGTITFDGTLRVAGWVIGEGRSVERLLADWADRSEVIRVTAERPDVAAAFGDALPNMPRVGFDQRVRVAPAGAAAGDITLRLALERPDGSRPVLAEVEVTSAVNPRWPTPRLSPVVATGLGRSGTTLLMRALAACPAVVVAGEYPYEAEVAVHVARAAHEALDLRRVRELPPELAELVAGPFVERTRAHFAAALDAFYGEAARLAASREPTDPDERGPAGGEPRYFAEKALPEAGAHFASLYGPDVKEIFLVRDFRDMVASVLAINARRGYPDFTRERYRSDVEYVHGAGRVVARLLQAWRERRDHALLVRYEELVTDLPAALRGIYGYLEADVAEPRLARIAEACAAGDGIGRGHTTSPSPRESVGRWRRDLAPEVREAAEESFGEALRVFGYTPEGSPAT